MIIINFSHPITTLQREEIATLIGSHIETIKILNVPAIFDLSESFVPQTTALIDSVPLKEIQWPIRDLLIVLPPYSPIAATILAELHGRIGYFPIIARIRPVPNTKPPKFEVGEIIDLQAIRNTARTRR